MLLARLDGRCGTLSVVLSIAIGCGGGSTAEDGGGGRDGGGGGDASVPRDGGGLDAGPGTDAGPGRDGGPGTDGGVRPSDGGMCMDLPPGSDRPALPTCSPCRPDVSPPPPTGRGCVDHSDCADGPNGRCVLGMAGPFCTYDECFTDDDCGKGEVCLCDGSIFGAANLCVPANCRTNADCARGTCAPSYGCLLGAPPVGYYCRTAGDTCASDRDCTMSAGGRCAFDPSADRWQCDYAICAL